MRMINVEAHSYQLTEMVTVLRRLKKHDVVVRLLLGLVVFLALSTSAMSAKTMRITFEGYTPSSGATLTNIPLLIAFSNDVDGSDFSYADFLSPQGHDLRFYDASGTELSYEVEEWDTNGTSYVWVCVPELADNTTGIRAEWGLDSALPAYTTNGAVWTNGYVAVWHMAGTNESQIADATVYNNHSTGVSGNPDLSVSGAVGSGLFLDGNDNVAIANADSLEGMTSLCLEAWVRDTVGGTAPRGIIGNRATGDDYYLFASSDLVFDIGNPRLIASPHGITQGAWTHVSAVFDGTSSSSNMVIYRNGMPITTMTSAQSAIDGNGGTIRLGSVDDADYYWTGDLDEIRISAVPRSAEWLHTTWLNVVSNDAFVGMEPVALGAQPIVTHVDPTNVSSTGACVNAELVSAGDSPATVSVYWGESDGATNSVAWSESLSVGTATSTPPVSYSASLPLASNHLYYYRYCASNASGRAWASASDRLLTAPVTLSVTDDTITEFSTNTAQLEIRRPAAAANASLSIGLDNGGTAEEGVDYATLSPFFDFGSGETSITVTVTGLGDALDETTETIIPTLMPGPYVVGTPSAGTITVHDVSAVMESPRNIPIVDEVDVVVVGGTSGGVAAAGRAAQDGASVFLVAERPYLGDDICGTRRLWLESGETGTTALASAVFPTQGPRKPMLIKQAFDRHLETNGVRSLIGYVTDVLVDSSNRMSGIVMANRAGRQAVKARVVIDATPRASVARMTGTEFDPYPTDSTQTFTRVVIGGPLATGPGVTGVTRNFEIEDRAVHDYTLQLTMPDGSFSSFMAAEHAARDLTYQPGQVDASERLFQVPPDPMQGKTNATGSWPGSQAVDIDVFRPESVPRLYVLGGCADLSREAAATMLRPHTYMEIGDRLGSAAAAEAASATLGTGVTVRAAAGGTDLGDVLEVLKGVRPTDNGLPVIASPERSLPILGTYDVVVVGGGTGGAAAGIGGGRTGSKTLLIEYQHGLGGVGTLGLIGKYWYGNRVGFTAELDAGVEAMSGSPYVIRKAEWWRRTNREAGVEVWLDTMGIGALVSDDTVTGVIVATPHGRGVILAKSTVDATGNSDIAAPAGADCVSIASTPEHMGVQGAGLPPRILGESYRNTDYTFSDDSDVVDKWHLYRYAREKFGGSYDLSTFIDTRERRRIVGDIMITPMDIMSARTYPDTIVTAKSDFDTHGYMVHPLFLHYLPPKKLRTAYVPYRALLPKHIDGILVTGLGVSAHRDAMPVIRMQADVQNQGYAAGHAAGMAATANIGPRDINVNTLQQHLVDTDILSSDVLEHTDYFANIKTNVAGAVKTLLTSSTFAGLSDVLMHWDTAQPLLQQTYTTTNSSAVRLRCAHVLGMMGDATGVEALIEAVEGYTAWDVGDTFIGMGDDGQVNQSDLDSYIEALGRCGHPAGLNALIAKTELLDADDYFSHHRAISYAFGVLQHPDAAKPLYDLLQKPKMTGWAITNMTTARTNYQSSDVENLSRNRSLREIVIARALFQCGDYNGAGRAVLEQYEQDLRGPFAQHAQAVLTSGAGAGGDVNDDQRITVVDALLVYKMLSGSTPFPESDTDAFNAADMDDNGVIDANDANRILQLVVGRY